MDTKVIIFFKKLETWIYQQPVTEKNRKHGIIPKIKLKCYVNHTGYIKKYKMKTKLNSSTPSQIDYAIPIILSGWIWSKNWDKHFIAFNIKYHMYSKETLGFKTRIWPQHNPVMSCEMELHQVGSPWKDRDMAALHLKQHG